jgi:hypothetical protein
MPLICKQLKLGGLAEIPTTVLGAGRRRALLHRVELRTRRYPNPRGSWRAAVLMRSCTSGVRVRVFLDPYAILDH